MSDQPLIRARGVRKSFGQVEVLHNVDLDLPGGQVTALLGENGAGKSTFVRILAGDYRPDGGTVTIDGADTANLGIPQIRDRGLRLISQEISDAPTLTVAENISLGAWPTRFGRVDRRAMIGIARDVLADLDSDLSPTAFVSSLSLGARQMVEIARAIAGRARCLILDEPTAALSDSEAQSLFRVIRRLKDSGVAILYITHRLDEVFALADRVCVLRDGKVSLDNAVSNVTSAVVIEAMVGHAVDVKRTLAGAPAETTAALSARGISGDSFTDIDLEVVPGQIVGLYGKLGSGVPEIAESLFGARKLTAGSIAYAGYGGSPHSPAEAISQGVAFLPPDRAGEAIFPVLSVAMNLAAPSWGRMSRAGFLMRRRELGSYTRWVQKLSIRATGDARQPITSLSGGNQQKVLLARWLEAESRVLVLVEPTRGVDVGARQEIYQVLRELAAEGKSIVIATSDYEDVVSAASTVHVVFKGRIVRTLDGDQVTVDALTEAAGGTRDE